MMNLATLGAAAAVLGTSLLAPSPAYAHNVPIDWPTAQTSTPHDSDAQAARRPAWHTIRHDSHTPTTNWTTRPWDRPRGARLMQVNSRCWGNDTRMDAQLRYKLPAGLGWKIVAADTWRCDGRYHTLRTSNAGHSKYRAMFWLNHKHTVEYWAQYYK